MWLKWKFYEAYKSFFWLNSDQRNTLTWLVRPALQLTVTFFFFSMNRESDGRLMKPFRSKTIFGSFVNLESMCPSAHTASTWSDYKIFLLLLGWRKETEGARCRDRGRWTKRERQPQEREAAVDKRRSPMVVNHQSLSGPRSKLSSINSRYHLKAVLKMPKWEKQGEQTSQPAHTDRPAISPT